MSDCPRCNGSLLLRGREVAISTAEEREVVDSNNKRADSNQVTMPPQRRADGDLAIGGCYEVEWTLGAPRAGGGAVRPGSWRAKRQMTYY